MINSESDNSVSEDGSHNGIVKNYLQISSLNKL